MSKIAAKRFYGGLLQSGLPVFRDTGDLAIGRRVVLALCAGVLVLSGCSSVGTGNSVNVAGGTTPRLTAGSHPQLGTLVNVCLSVRRLADIESKGAAGGITGVTPAALTLKQVAQEVVPVLRAIEQGGDQVEVAAAAKSIADAYQRFLDVDPRDSEGIATSLKALGDPGLWDANDRIAAFAKTGCAVDLALSPRSRPLSSHPSSSAPVR